MSSHVNNKITTEQPTRYSDLVLESIKLHTVSAAELVAQTKFHANLIVDLISASVAQRKFKITTSGDGEERLVIRLSRQVVADVNKHGDDKNKRDDVPPVPWMTVQQEFTRRFPNKTFIFKRIPRKDPTGPEVLTGCLLCVLGCLPGYLYCSFLSYEMSGRDADYEVTISSLREST